MREIAEAWDRYQPWDKHLAPWKESMIAGALRAELRYARRKELRRTRRARDKKRKP